MCEDFCISMTKELPIHHDPVPFIDVLTLNVAHTVCGTQVTADGSGTYSHNSRYLSGALTNRRLSYP